MTACVNAIVLILTTHARAAGDDTLRTTVVDTLPAEARLASAVARYLEGDVAAARTELQALLANGPSLPPEVRSEALAYLGDILYSEQGAEASRSVFEALLREAPDYRLDPYAHPAPVCAWVEQVARDLQARAVVIVPPVLATSPPPSPPRFTYDVLIPGGFHALRTGKPVLGASLAVVQTASAVVSIATRASIEAAFATQELRLTGEQDVAQPEAAATERLIWINRAAATAGWLAWGVPVAVEVARWSSGGNATASVRVTPGGVSVAGAF